MRVWWRNGKGEIDPRVQLCPTCGCPIQQTPAGTVTDGLRIHNEYVHPAATVGAL